MRFEAAQPIWPEGRTLEKNILVGFRAAFFLATDRPTILRIAAAAIYRAFLNGELIGCGPARGPHGWYRVDEWNLPTALLQSDNILAIEVAGYNVNSYALLDQPSFLLAEVVCDGSVLAATGGAGFEAALLPERVQKVQRYSFQRPFMEVYRLTDDYGRWQTDLEADWTPIACEETPEKQLLPRGVPYPRLEKRPPVWDVAQGKFSIGPPPETLRRDWSLTDIGPNLGGFPESELETIPTHELQSLQTESREEIGLSLTADPVITLPNHSYHILDLGTNLTGFLGLTVSCREQTRILVTFDEILSDGDVDFLRMGSANVISYELPPGTYALESLEPYTLRYLKLLAAEGAAEVSQLYLRDYANPDTTEAQFSCSDRRLNRLFEAGRETYRQNALDIFMDCPSRERAGWLCDSFFTARVAYDLSGKTQVERNFYENYLLPPSFPPLPEGMVPMCYPADHPDGNFIPNWALWFILELEEYARRTDAPAMISALREKALGILEYFRPFLNEDGLLEKLERWVFLEWSRANDFVQDVNYPSNMLYAAALDAAGRIYALPALRDQAAQVRQTVARLSFDGEFFTDNAVRQNGKLEATQNRTEVCQYYAFFCEVATPETYPALWKTLTEQFGPSRKQTGAFPEIFPANAFIGNYLRLELLSRYGLRRQMLDESVDYLLYMAERTGTLWEHDGATASCNHGFASHIVHALYRDVLGVAEISSREKTIGLRFADLSLDWCEGRMPLPDGALTLSWWTEGETLCYRLNHPAGYTITVESDCPKQLIRRT